MNAPECPSLERWIAYAGPEPDPREEIELTAHLEQCPRCRQRVREIAALGELPPAPVGACPTGETLVRWAGGALSDEEARPLEPHVADCAACLERLAAALPSRQEPIEASLRERVLKPLTQSATRRAPRRRPTARLLGVARGRARRAALTLGGSIAALAAALLLAYLGIRARPAPVTPGPAPEEARRPAEAPPPPAPVPPGPPQRPPEPEPRPESAKTAEKPPDPLPPPPPRPTEPPPAPAVKVPETTLHAVVGSLEASAEDGTWTPLDPAAGGRWVKRARLRAGGGKPARFEWRTLTVCVNAGSEVLVESRDDVLEVELAAGEVYLHTPTHREGADVATGPRKALARVVTSRLHAEIWGTAFGVKIEPRRDLVVVERGRVGVGNERGRVVVGPGEAAAAAQGSAPAALKEIDVHGVTSWVGAIKRGVFTLTGKRDYIQAEHASWVSSDFEVARVRGPSGGECLRPRDFTQPVAVEFELWVPQTADYYLGWVTHVEAPSGEGAPHFRFWFDHGSRQDYRHDAGTAWGWSRTAGPHRLAQGRHVLRVSIDHLRGGRGTPAWIDKVMITSDPGAKPGSIVGHSTLKPSP